MEDKHAFSGGANEPLEGLPQLSTTDWPQTLAGTGRSSLEAAIASGLPARRWFGAKTRAIRRVAVVDAFEITPSARILLVEVHYADGPADVYQLPLAIAEEVQAVQIARDAPWAVWARIADAGAARDGSRLLCDAVADADFRAVLVGYLDNNSHVPGSQGELAFSQAHGFAAARGDVSVPLTSRLSQAEQSNTSLIYGDRLILKLLRRVDAGLNPDLELSRHLSARGFPHTPALAGAIEYRTAGREPWALAIAQQFVPNQGDAWQYFLSRLAIELGAARMVQDAAREAIGPPQVTDAAGLVAAASASIPADVTATFGSSVADAARFGQRTAELHLALADAAGDPEFVPEPLLPEDQQAFAAGAQALVAETYDLLRRQVPNLGSDLLPLANDVLARQPRVNEQLAQFAPQPIAAQRMRIHGDYHLGQVLVSGDDFAIIDFEGEPARPLAERRRKQVALRDVAGMIRSFHYASRAAAAAAHITAGQSATAVAADSARDAINRRAAAWYYWTSVAFLGAYRRAACAASFLPRSDEPFARLLAACLLEKAVYELRYELNNRPDWVYLPLTALAELVP